MVVAARNEWSCPEPPDVSHIVTEDDAPVDNFFSEKQQRLLTETLYSSWEGPRSDEGHPRPYIASSNVGLFATPKNDPLVPDVFVSLDVSLHEDIWAKEHRTYFFWEMGKPPDVVIEVVSNREGGELDRKLSGYARMRIAYYVVYDPDLRLGSEALHAFELRGGVYAEIEPWFESLELCLIEWEGTFEGMAAKWLRWVRRDGSLVLTGAERAEAEAERADAEAERAEAEAERAEAETKRADAAAQRAEAETKRAEAETKRADAEAERAERLAKRLRELGIDPTE